MKLKQLLLLVFSSFLFQTISFAQDKAADSAKQRKKEMMDILYTKPKAPVKTIGIYLYNGYQTIDAMGPYEVLSQLMGVKVFFIAKERGFVRNQSGLKVQVDTTIDKVKRLDMLLIPGGAAETFMQTQDQTVLNWIRAIDSTTIYTASVCTGAWILGATGLLKGKNATTNWYRADEMLTRYGAHFKQERWVRDGKYWTSAGVTAGLDMSLAIIHELMGDKYTQGVMLNLEYDPAPPVTGGSVNKTPAIVVDMMREMYDLGLKPLITKYGKKSKVKSQKSKVKSQKSKVKSQKSKKMKRDVMLVMILLIAIVSCQQPVKKDGADNSGAMQKDTVMVKTVLATSKDLACGMSVTADVADTAHYNGKVYGFCSPDCKKGFQSDPETYLAQ